MQARGKLHASGKVVVATLTLAHAFPRQGPSQAAPVWQRRSTREVPGSDRFDFWRQFPAGAYMEHPLGTRGDFFGEFKFTATPDGVALGEFGIDPCISRFGPGRDDTIVDIGMINAGSMHIRYGRDQTLTLHAGSTMLLFDPARPMTTRTTRSDFTYLRLPRTAVVAALGAAAIPRGVAVRPLAPSVLTSQLAACLHGVQRESGQTVPSVIKALHTAKALALVALARVRGMGHHWSGELDAALYLAACHQLLQQIANPRATVDGIAVALGCSRAQLYRLFAARGESVAGRLRDVRLQRAAELLVAQPGAAVGALANQCGYAEPIAFDRAFRRRFGMTPSDWRAARAEDPRTLT